MTKKNIALLLLAAGTVGGLLGFFGHGTLALLYVSSFLIGVSLGGLNPTGPALIGEYASADRRASLNGLYSIILSVGGMVTAILAGILARGSWNRVYLFYMLLIPIFLLCLFLIPGGGVIENTQNKAETASGGKFLNRQVLHLYGVAVFVSVTWVVYNSNVSYLLEGNAAMSGFVNVVFMGGMFVAGSLVNQFQKLFKKQSIPAAVTMCAASLWILSQSGGNIVLLCVGSALLGIGYCAYTALSYAKLPEIAMPGTMTKAMSFFAAIASGGALLHPYLVTVPAGMLGGTVSMRFVLSAAIMTAGAIVAFIPVKGETEKG